MHRNRRWLLVLALAAGGVGGLWWYSRPAAPQFVTAAVTRGDVVRSVITTGAVNPVVTVQVGTYVSGVIQALYCDYNTPVKAGQLCAKIDPRPYQVVVDQASANLASAQAQLRKDEAAVAFAKIIYARDRKLLGHGGVSQETVDTDKSNLDQGIAQIGLDQATIQQRQAALHAAQVDLDYTDIVSPVDGVVVSRSIDVGQTVAASFQTPTLFLIAKDLTRMQVDTNVSESDVGAVRVGQKAFFTVAAYPEKTFWGKVTQLRQAPITVQNVVTYDAVVGVNNPDLELLPGMTANTRIITDERTDVLRVPVQALRFSPAGHAQAEGSDDAAEPAGATEGSGAPGQAGKEAHHRDRASRTQVWVVRSGRPVPVPVTAGLSDGTLVEITGGDLEVGQRVIVNELGPSESARAHSRSLFRFR
jgi:HlyD family secretion protein